METTEKIGFSQVVKSYEASIEDGIPKPFEIVFYKENGEIRKLLCHKPLRQDSEASEPTANNERERTNGLGYNIWDSDLWLIENMHPANERDRIKSIHKSLVLFFNRKRIDHKR